MIGEDGDAEDRVGMGGKEVVGEPLGFAAEDKGVAGAVFNLGIGARATGTVEENAHGFERVEAGLP